MNTPRDELARLCRQIYLDNEVREHVRDEAIDTRFNDALAEVRTKFGPQSVTEDELVAVMQTEQSRVADAVTLADVVAPRLAFQLRQQNVRHTPIPFSPAPAAETDIRPLPATVTKSNPSAAPLGIADFIDGMLDQDREAARSRAASRR
jgi:hypothetical protein